VRLADRAGHSRLRVASRLALADALIHSVGGFDEEGMAVLHEADRVATADGDVAAAAHAQTELGYVDFLRARYDRATPQDVDALSELLVELYAHELPDMLHGPHRARAALTRRLLVAAPLGRRWTASRLRIEASRCREHQRYPGPHLGSTPLPTSGSAGDRPLQRSSGTGGPSTPTAFVF
jgi:hypothetical protein